MNRHLLIIVLAVWSTLALGQGTAPAQVEAVTNANKLKSPLPAPVAAKAAAKATVQAKKRSPEDIDLWAFSTSNALASAPTIDALKALPGFLSEQREALKPSIEGKEVPKFPAPVTLNYENGLRVRLIDYGTQAFVSQVKVTSSKRELTDGLKVGVTREEVEAVLGPPTRATSYHMLYEGKSDTIRFLFDGGLVSAVEVDRGD